MNALLNVDSFTAADLQTLLIKPINLFGYRYTPTPLPAYSVHHEFSLFEAF